MKLWPATRKCMKIVEEIGDYSAEEYANYAIVSWFALRLPQLASDLTLEVSESERRKLTEVAHWVIERETLSSDRLSIHLKTENLEEWELAVLHEQICLVRLRLHDLIDASSAAALRLAQERIHEELRKRFRNTPS